LSRSVIERCAAQYRHLQRLAVTVAEVGPVSNDGPGAVGVAGDERVVVLIGERA
jgi:hypothetical protein